jgi:hypothetical protein
VSPSAPRHATERQNDVEVAVMDQARRSDEWRPSFRRNKGSSDLHKESLGGGITLKSTNKPTQRGRAKGAHLESGRAESESKRQQGRVRVKIRRSRPCGGRSPIFSVTLTLRVRYKGFNQRKSASGFHVAFSLRRTAYSKRCCTGAGEALLALCVVCVCVGVAWEHTQSKQKKKIRFAVPTNRSGQARP